MSYEDAKCKACGAIGFMEPYVNDAGTDRQEIVLVCECGHEELL